ncbi:hypothetical protein BJ878DRAFT_545156 [Calycina marina]|uniref:Uncharacterized protein n=1 Tax=Calycina marina TaxID=1763456 RepID=A0A9P7YY43_9HELO|nr:hypothetical protein BJ878DRAFT_545156 [Calycina marina]
MFSKTNPQGHTIVAKDGSARASPMKHFVTMLFLIIFALSVAELGFTVDSFIYLQRKHKWWSSTERARVGFLIFSCCRTIFLAATYSIGQCYSKKPFGILHTLFCVMSTILWVVSGVLIHQMWGYAECQNEGIADTFDEAEAQLKEGLSECHEIKIIEIIAWVIAAISVVASIPVVVLALKSRKEQKHQVQQKSAISG